MVGYMAEEDPGDDASNLAHPPSFPVACPHCAAPQGYPYRVETSKESRDQVNVSLRCKDCQHSWMIQRLSAPPPPE